jgi:hypothetical protein
MMNKNINCPLVLKLSFFFLQKLGNVLQEDNFFRQKEDNG